MHRLYVHCSLYAGRELDEPVDFPSLCHWLDATDTIVINTHFAVLRSELPADGADLAEVVIERAVQSVERLGEIVEVERIVIENIPYPTRFWYDDLLPEVADPAVISEVVRRTGCGLLLDLAHAIRACEGTGREDVRAYLDALPVRALRELHVVGIIPEADDLGIRQVTSQ